MPCIECPICGKEVEISGEKFPERACDTELCDCPACGREIELGWYAVFEASVPNTASTPTGGSAPVPGQLSTPENTPSNHPVSVPPTSG